MDVAARDSNGTAVLKEAKSSATAPLTKAQALAHPEIEKTGATVMGQGKPGFPGGTKIPPTKVEVVRPKPNTP
jgi:filamentous hemagglutinin